MAIATEAALQTTTDAFNARDMDSIAGLLADDVVFRAPGAIGSEGRDACLEYYRRWWEDFRDANLEVHAVWVVDDAIVEEGTFTGTHTGAAATGVSVAVDYVQVLRPRGARFASVNLKFDRLQLLEQLGLLGG